MVHYTHLFCTSLKHVRAEFMWAFDDALLGGACDACACVYCRNEAYHKRD